MYDDALAIGSTNHNITESTFSTWMFTYPLYKCDDQYKKAAFAKAYETVGSFASDIVMLKR